MTCVAKLLSDLSCVIIIGFVIPSNSGEHPAFSVAKSITADDCVSAEMLTDTQFLEHVRAGFTFFFLAVFPTDKVTCRHSQAADVIGYEQSWPRAAEDAEMDLLVVVPLDFQKRFTSFKWMGRRQMTHFPFCNTFWRPRNGRSLRIPVRMGRPNTWTHKINNSRQWTKRAREWTFNLTFGSIYNAKRVSKRLSEAQRDGLFSSAFCSGRPHFQSF